MWWFTDGSRHPDAELASQVTRLSNSHLPLRGRWKVALSLLVIGLLSSAVTLGVYGLFSATAQNSGNEITSGTVSFTDNDAGAALYNVSSIRPGETVSSCIKVTYGGSIAAASRLFSTGTPGPLAQYIDLTVTQGTQATSTFPSCAGFSADAVGVLYSGTLQAFEQTRNSYASGIATAPAGKSSWSNGEAVVYRFQATLQTSAPDASQGTSSGVHAFAWEARSQ
jgi:hypothetical protein